MYELYIRTSNYVSHNAAKAVETAHGSFYMQAPDQEGS